MEGKQWLTESGTNIESVMDVKYMYKCIFLSPLNSTRSTSMEQLQLRRVFLVQTVAVHAAEKIVQCREEKVSETNFVPLEEFKSKG